MTALAGFGLGWWVDERFKTSPWGLLALTLGGIVVALYRLVRTFSSRSSSGRR